MNKLIKTILISSIAIFSAVVLVALPAKATQVDDDLIVEYSSDGGNIWLPFKAAIFSETNILPGEDVSRLVKVVNNINPAEDKKIAVEAINYPGFPDKNNIPVKDLSRALIIIIREKDGSDLYGGSSPTGVRTLFDFYKNGETYLSNIFGKSAKTYEFVIIFPETAGNDWNPENTDDDKRPTTSFAILVGFQGDEGGGGGGGGGGGSGGVLPPGLTIQNEVADTVTENSVTINWLTSYFSTSQVIYALADGIESHILNLNDNVGIGGMPPRYGYARTTPETNINPPETNINPKVTFHTVTITGLTSGTKYYFRAVSHGSLAISQERSFTTAGKKEEASIREATEEKIIEPPENQQDNDAVNNDEIKISGNELSPTDYGNRETLAPAQGIGPEKKSATEEEVKVLGAELDQIDADEADQANPAIPNDSGAKTDLKPEATKNVQEIADNSTGATGRNFKKWWLPVALLVIIVIEIIYLIAKRRKQ